MRIGWWCALLAGCAPRPAPGELWLVVEEASDADVVEAFVASVGDPRLVVRADTRRPAADTPAVWVRREPGCEGCYRVDRQDAQLTASGGDTLGMLYAVTHALEAYGYRFHHPYRAHLPERVDGVVDAAGLDVDHAPEIARRGLHLHTLHPIEGLFDLWEPEADPARGRAIVDWVVRQRGNHLQWVGLADVLNGGARLAGWQAQTAAVQAHARRVGVTTGLGIQLFASGNLQLALDLIESPGSLQAQRAQVAPRLDALTSGGVDFDVYNLSFGEFFAEEPDRFLESLGMVYDEIVARDPDAEVTTVIHVGDDLETTYQGETFLYYFLATRTDRPIVPWIHTVMFYNLFEDAGGAYHHDAFDQHRDYLLDAIEAQEPVGYFPESAYWIAFDNPVPQSFWVYLHSRWLDLARLAAFADERGVPGLQDHVVFASGWEWNHWLYDSAALRMGYELPDRWRDHVDHAYRVFGEAGGRVADAVAASGEVQARSLIDDRLTPWIASYDNVMELGYGIDKVSQPIRIHPREWLDGTASRARLAAEVEGLTAYREALEEAAPSIAQALAGDRGEPPNSPFLREAEDGLAINLVRARFSEALARAVLRAVDDEDPGPALDDADAALRAAAEVVARRHADLHDPGGERLVTVGDNATLYNFGYLHRAETLCYWIRERNQLHNTLDGGSRPVPGCSIEKADPPTVEETVGGG